MLHKNVEIFAVGKIAEFATFTGEERLKSPDRFCLIRATASYKSEEGVSRLIPYAHWGKSSDGLSG